MARAGDVLITENSPRGVGVSLRFIHDKSKILNEKKNHDHYVYN